MPVDVRLNAIVDPERAGGRPLVDLARAAVAGGATLVQLRDKHGHTRRLIDTARALIDELSPLGVPLIVNDRVDVALAAGASGVHLGPDDMEIADARALLGPAAIIGHSIKSIAQAEAVPIELIDYAGVGGVYATLSKDNPAPPMGPAGLGAIRAVLRRRAPTMPVVGIAGIDTTNAAAAIAAGADGVAVISALSLAADPEMAARALRAIVDGALAQRQA
ncbi:MAG: thiamine phosphate synthase [Rhodoplanes sp.]|uniref:thiamine phosphate synthase n=1 Tax=Rhodoplanes sp. TaxID=1968906 RepID=UPI001857E4FE|nr:thiamine phosphate synthase [Rhodoplanes sp.]NVO15646.1 thiamine phosphate synthase [Rhodoplanes sp.]